MNLWGKLDHFSIVEIIQFLQSNQKSGRLECTCQKEKIELDFFEGSLVSANHNNVDHKKSFLASKPSPHERETVCEAIAEEIQFCIQKLLDWKQGNFTFSDPHYTTLKALEENKGNLLLPQEMRTEFLLMESLRKFDEKKEAPVEKKSFVRIEKSLKEYLFQVHCNQQTAKITVRSGKKMRTLFFEQGELVLVMSNLVEESLGELLIRKSLITREALQETRAIMEKTKKKQGEVLVEQGILSAFQMFELLKEQMHEKLIHCFLESDIEVLEESYDPSVTVIQKFPVDFFRCYVESFPATTPENQKALEGFYLRLNEPGKKYLQTRTLRACESKLTRLLQEKIAYTNLLSEAKEHLEECTRLVDFLGSVHFIDFSTH